MEENGRKRQRERERKIEMRRRQVRRQKMILGGGAAGILLLLILVLAVRGIAGSAAEKARTEKMEKQEQAQKAREKEPEKVSLTISAAGDCTLGTDENFYYATSLPAKYEAVQDPGYFFQKVLPVFSKDDLTIVNMEGTLTQETAREAKLYAFKGDEEYTQILTEGSVEAANLANNHSHDYGEKSYTDTIQALEDAGITTFGYDRTAVMDIKGIKYKRNKSGPSGNLRTGRSYGMRGRDDQEYPESSGTGRSDHYCLFSLGNRAGKYPK